MLYNDRIRNYFENPRNVGSFDSSDPAVGTGMEGAPAIGMVVKLQVKVDAQGVINKACFKTYGCGSAIAASSLVTEWVIGKTLEDAEALHHTQIAEALELSPGKIQCSVLAVEALNAALNDYRFKQRSNDK